MNFRYIVFTVFLINVHFLSQGQQAQNGIKNSKLQPALGVACPGFHFTDVRSYPKKEVKNEDFLGKWLVLYLWNNGCGYCIASLPNLSKIRTSLRSSLEVLTVAYTGSQYTNNGGPEDARIKKTYEKQLAKHRLEFPIAFDSILFHQFEIGPCPYIVIIDPSGYVRGITTKITEADISSLIQGKSVTLSPAYRKGETDVPYDINYPFLVNGNGGSDTSYEYRSVFGRVNDFTPSSGMHSFEVVNHNFNAIGFSIECFFNFAYLGKPTWDYRDIFYENISNRPIFLLKKSSSLKMSGAFLQTIYFYSATRPACSSSKEDFRLMLQNDLKSYFKFKVTIKEQKMPCLYLVRTRKGQQKDRKQNDGESMISSSQELIRFLYYNYSSNKLPIINTLNRKKQIEVFMNKEQDDSQIIKRILNQNGYDLKVGKKRMKVLIIED